MDKKQAIALAVKSAREMGAAEERAKYERARPTAAAPVKVDEKDWGEGSWARVALSLANKDKSVAKKEWDLSQDLCGEEYKRKASSYANDTSAGFLVPSGVVTDQIIPLLRSKTVLEKLPGLDIRRNLVGSPIPLNRQTGGVTTGMIGEGQTATATDGTYERINLQPHTAYGLSRVSNLLLKLSPGSADTQIKNDIGKGIARTVTRQFFMGTGVGAEVLGLKATSGINTQSVAGSNATVWTKLQQLLELIDVNDGNGGDEGDAGLAFVMHPRDWHDLCQIQLPQATNGATNFVGQAVLTRGSFADGILPTLMGYPVFTTTAISSTTADRTVTDGVVYLFDPSQVILGQWGVLELQATSEGATLLAARSTDVGGYLDFDVKVMQPKAIATGTAFAIS